MVSSLLSSITNPSRCDGVGGRGWGNLTEKSSSLRLLSALVGWLATLVAAAAERNILERRLNQPGRLCNGQLGYEWKLPAGPSGSQRRAPHQTAGSTQTTVRRRGTPPLQREAGGPGTTAGRSGRSTRVGPRRTPTPSRCPAAGRPATPRGGPFLSHFWSR